MTWNAGSAEHTDADLFTVNLWRSCPNPGLPAGAVHIGKIGELVGLGPATRHHVAPSTETQRSLVYFAIPDHAAALPSGESVGEWLDREIAMMRVVMK